MTWDVHGVSIELQLDAQAEHTYAMSYEHDILGAVAREAIKNREKGAL